MEALQRRSALLWSLLHVRDEETGSQRCTDKQPQGERTVNVQPAVVTLPSLKRNLVAYVREELVELDAAHICCGRTLVRNRAHHLVARGYGYVLLANMSFSFVWP